MVKRSLNRVLHHVLLYMIMFSFVMQGPMIRLAYAAGPPIVTDGRTNTSVVTNGSVTDVRTETIHGKNAYNSFERFNVPGGNTTNLHVPDSANNLINMVNAERSHIDGVLNAYKNGSIGGNVYFLNPHGMVIGSTGVVNVGSLTMRTPTQEYMNQLMDQYGQVSLEHERMLFNGSVPLNNSGLISVKGKINAIDTIDLRAGTVNVDRNAAVLAGRRVSIDFGDVVNVKGLQSGNEIQMSSDGKIRIGASGDVNISGTVAADGVAGENAGSVEITAGNDITLDNGALVAARGMGENSDGGDILIFADNDAFLKDGAVIDVSSLGSGDAGFAEFSAVDTVSITGNGLRASANDGKAGTILIDPDNIILSQQTIDRNNYGISGISLNGANLILLADKSISITDSVVSSRVISGSDHEKDDSTGNSGNITIIAPNVVLKNSKILAHATGNYTAGDVTITLLDKVEHDGKMELSLYEKTEVSFEMDSRSVIKGKDITIDAKAIASTLTAIKDTSEKDEETSKVEEENKSFLSKIFEQLEDLPMDKISALFGLSSSDKKDPLSKLPLSGGYNSAVASIVIDGTLDATGDIKIGAEAEAIYEISNFGKVLSGAGVMTNTYSSITINDGAKLNAKGSIDIDSHTNTKINLISTAKNDSNTIPVDITFAFGLSYNTNEIEIAKGSSLTAGKDINIEALSDRWSKFVVNGGKESGDTFFGAALAFLYADSDTMLKVDGTLTSGGDVDLSARTNVANNAMIVTSTIGGNSQQTGGNQGEKSDEEKQKSEGFLSKITGGFQGLADKVGGKLGRPSGADDDSQGGSAGETNNKAWNQLGLAGAVGMIYDQVDTDAIIGGNAVINAKNISLNAQTDNNISVATNAYVKDYYTNNEEQQNKIAASVGVPLVFMKNYARATVEAGANLTAVNKVDIDSETTIPYKLENYVIVSLIQNLQKNGFTIDALMEGLDEWELDKALGLSDSSFNTWSQATANGDDLALAGTVSLIFLDNIAISQIADDAVKSTTINAKELNVTANTETLLSNLSGAMKHILGDTTIRDMFKSDDSGDENEGEEENAEETKKSFLTKMNGTSGENAIGASFLGSFFGNVAISRIDGGTLNIAGGDVNVEANSKAVEVGIVVAGGEAKSFGFNGMAGLTQYDSYTLAKIDDAVKVTAKDVNITAIDTAYRIGFSGGYTKSETAAIGVAGIVTLMERDAHAVWGNLLNDKGELQKIWGDKNKETIASALVESNVTGKVDVSAKATGYNIVAALSGTAVTKGDPNAGAGGDTSGFTGLYDTSGSNGQSVNGMVSGGSSSNGTGSDFGLGISGAVAVNILKENVTAGISGNVKISADSFEVKADNDILDVSIGGGLTVNTTGSDSSVGLAGAFGLNILEGRTMSYVDLKPNADNLDTGTRLTYTKTFDMLAQRNGTLVAVSAGAAGAASSGGLNLAGSVSYASIEDDTIARINAANIVKTAASTTGDMKVHATNDADIINVAGGLVIGGSVGVGLGMAASNLSIDTRTMIGSSTIDAGSLDMLSQNSSLIVTIALAGAVSKNVALGGTLAFAMSDGKTYLEVDGSTITLSGDFTANANSLASNESKNNSYYSDLSKELEGAESKDADKDSQTSYLSKDGSSIDLSRNSDETSPVDKDGEETDDIKYEKESKEVKLGIATRSPKVVTAALAVAASTSVAVGANIGLNILTDQNYTKIVDSTITSTGGKADINAKTHGGTIAVALGISGSTGAAAVSGNVGVTLMGGRTETVFENSTLDINKGLNVGVDNQGGILTISVNVAGASGQAGVAAGVSYNQIAHSTAIKVLDGSDLSSTNGKVKLDVSNSNDIIATLLSVGGGGTAGVGVALAINTIGTLTGSDSDSQEDEEELRDNLAKMFGNNPFKTIGESKNRTEIVIENSKITGRGFDSTDITTKNSIELGVSSSGKILSISVGAGFGGTVGAGAAASYNNISGFTGITNKNETGSLAEKVTLDAEYGFLAGSTMSNEIIAVSIGGGGGGTVGVGIGLAGNVIQSTNKIDLDGAIFEAKNNIDIFTLNEGDIIAAGGGIGGGGTVGVGGASTVNIIKGDTSIDIKNGSDIKSTEGSVYIESENSNKIIAVAAAGAGGGAVGVAGAVGVNLISAKTTTDVTGSTIWANNNLAVLATTGGEILSIVGGVAISGAVSVGGGVAYNDIGSTTTVGISDSTLDALGNSATGYEGVRGLTVKAYNSSDIQNFLVVLTGSGTVAISASAAVNNLHGKTETSVIGNSKLNTDNGGNTGQGTLVMAENSNKSFSVVTGLSISGVFAGTAVVDTHLFDQTVDTIVKNSTVNAVSKVDIRAKDLKNANSYTAGLAGGIVGVGISNSTVVSNGKTNITLEDANIKAGSVEINADNTVKLEEVVASVGIGGVGVGTAFGINVFKQTTGIDIKNTSKDSGKIESTSTSGDVSISATGNTTLQQISTSIAAGAVGVSASLGLNIIEDQTSIGFTNAVIESKKDVNINSLSNFVQEESAVGGVSVGAAAGGGGILIVIVRNNSSVSGDVDITAKNGTVTTDAKVNRNIKDATAFAGSGGLVGLSVAVSVISLGGMEVDKDVMDEYLSGTFEDAQKNQNSGIVNTKSKDENDKKMQADLNKEENKNEKAVYASQSKYFNDTDYLDDANDKYKASGDQLSSSNLTSENKNLSSYVNLSGTWDAKNISITGTIDNDVNSSALGVAVGGIAAGAGVSVLTIKDNSSINFSGKANTSGNFTLGGDTFHKINNYSVAGALGLGSLAASVSTVITKSDVAVNLGDSADIRSEGAVNIYAKRGLKTGSKNEAIAAAVGGVGVGGAFAVFEDSGDTNVTIGKASILSNKVNIASNIIYGTVLNQSYGVAGGYLLGGAGVVSVTDFSGNTNVNLNGTRIDVILPSTQKYPTGTETLKIASAVVMSVSNDSLKSVSDVFSGGIAAIPIGASDFELAFNTNINVNGGSIRSGNIAFESYQNLVAASLVRSIGAGLVGGCEAFADIALVSNNTINITGTGKDGKFIEAWGEKLSLVAGKGKNSISTQARVFNEAAVPVSVSKAKTNVVQNDTINVKNSSLRSVQNVELQTNRQENEFIAFGESTNLYKQLSEGDFSVGWDNFFGTSGFATKQSSGTLRNVRAGQVNVNDSLLEAGMNYYQYIKFEKDGTVDKSDYFEKYEIVNDYNVAQYLSDYLKELGALQLEYESEVASDNDAKKDLIEALKAQIEFVEGQLSVYYKNYAEKEAYTFPTIVFDNIKVVASSGDVVLDTLNFAGQNNEITAHGDVKIEIKNDTARFMDLVNSHFEIIDRSGGRILYNGNIVLNDDTFKQFNARPTNVLGNNKYDSIGEGPQIMPIIHIYNSSYTTINDLAPELFIRGTNIYNFGGQAQLDSTGSIWLNTYTPPGQGAKPIDYNLIARDIFVTTGGIFYQAYTLGFSHEAGDPHLSEAFKTFYAALKKYQPSKVKEYFNTDGTLKLDKISFYEFTEDASGEYKELKTKIDLTIDNLERYSDSDSWTAFVNKNTTGKGDDAEIDWTEGLDFTMLLVDFEGSDIQDQYDYMVKLSKNPNASEAEKKKMAQEVLEEMYGTLTGNNGLLAQLDQYFVGFDANGTSSDSIANIPKEIATWSDANPDNKGKISAGRSVFIAAQMLNINGIIESGYLDFNIDLTKDVNGKLSVDNDGNVSIADIISAYGVETVNSGVYDISQFVFGVPSTDVSDKFKPYSAQILLDTNGDANTITISDLVAQGGNITLFGNIISTGNGKLSVADGYGDIKIIGRSDSDLVLGKLDTTLGTKGTISITDTSKSTIGNNNLDNYLRTVYTREFDSNGDSWIILSTNTGTDGSMVQESRTKVDPDAPITYAPTANRWIARLDGKQNIAAQWLERHYEQVRVVFWYDQANMDAYAAGVNVQIDKSLYDNDGTSLQYLVTVDPGFMADVIAEITKNKTKSSSGEEYTDGTDINMIGFYWFDMNSQYVWSDSEGEFAGLIQDLVSALNSKRNNTDGGKTVYPTVTYNSDGTFTVSNFNFNRRIELTKTPTFETNPPKKWKDWKKSDYAWNRTGSNTREKAYKYVEAIQVSQYWETYINASHEIAIEFTGNSKGNIDVNSPGLITLTDLVRSSHDASITSETSNILGTGSALVEAQDLTLDAGGRIGGVDKVGGSSVDTKGVPLALNIGVPLQPLDSPTITSQSTLTATTKNGSIDIAHSNGNLIVNKIESRGEAKSANVNNYVNLSSSGNILMKDGGDGIISMGDITVFSESGRLGGVKNGDLFKIRAVGNVRIETNGNIDLEYGIAGTPGDPYDFSNLFVDQIISNNGNILLKVPYGSIYDKNTYEMPDPLADGNQLAAMWAELGLIPDGDNNDVWKSQQAAAISAFENEITALYFETWTAFNENPESVEGTSPVCEFKYNEDQRRMMLESGITEDEILESENLRNKLCNEALAGDFNVAFKFKLDDAEHADVIAGLTKDKSSWSEDILKNAIATALFIQQQDAGNRQNTTSIIEKPNFKGRNITLDVYGSIGTAEDDPVVITKNDMPADVNADPLKRRAMADAEWDDLTIVRNGEDIITELQIKLYDDVNIDASGTLKLTTKNGAIYLGSQNDTEIDQIVSGTNGNESIRLKIDGNLTAFQQDINNPRANIIAKNAILEAAGGYLGTKDNPLLINLTGTTLADGWIVARGQDGVAIRLVDGSLDDATAFVREIGSTEGHVFVQASEFVNALPQLTSARIGGVVIELLATDGDIGSEDVFMTIFQKDYVYGDNGLEYGSSSLEATGGIWVRNPTSSFNFVKAKTGEGEDFLAQAVINIVLAGEGADRNMINGKFDLLAETGFLNVNANVTANDYFKAEAAKNITVNGTILAKGGSLIGVSDNSLQLIAGTFIELDGKVETEKGSAYLLADGGSIILNDTLTVRGGGLNDSDTSLSMIADESIKVGEAVVVKAGNVNMTARTGDINDYNDDESTGTRNLDIDAVNSNLIMTAFSGIGSDDALEIKAKSMKLNVTDQGNIGIDNRISSDLLEAITADGYINILLGGALNVYNVKAGGDAHSIFLGASDDINFTSDANLTADKHIIAISEKSVKSESENTKFRSEDTFLVAADGNISSSNGGMFKVDIEGALHLLANSSGSADHGSIYVEKVNEGDFIIGTAMAAEDLELVQKADYDMILDRILARNITFDAANVNIGTTGTSMNFTLKGLVDEIHKNPAADPLMSYDTDIAHKEVTLKNKRQGGRIKIDTYTIRGGDKATVEVDNLVIKEMKLSGDGEAVFNHTGGENSRNKIAQSNDNIADSTVIENIIGTPDLKFEQLYSNNVDMNATQLDANLKVVDGYTDVYARIVHGGVIARVDSNDYSSKWDSNFQFLSTDSRYAMETNHSGVNKNGDSMHTLHAFPQKYLLDGKRISHDSLIEDILEDQNQHMNYADKLVADSQRRILVHDFDPSSILKLEGSIIQGIRPQNGTIRLDDIISPEENDEDDDSLESANLPNINLLSKVEIK